MLTYYKTQLFSELKSMKIWLVSLLFFITSYALAYYSNRFDFQSGEEFTLIHILYGVIAFLTFLFSSILFSGMFSREIENQSLRFITPYLSRRKIYFAKLFVMLTIFTIILSVSLGIAYLVGTVTTFPLFDTFSFALFIIYIQSAILLISLLSPSDRLASIIGLLLSIVSPLLFVLSTVMDNAFLDALNWLLPYRYIGLEDQWQIIILLLFVSLMIVLGYKIFERKEI